MAKASIAKYGYLVTFNLFSGSINHWYMVSNQEIYSKNLRDTFENWQSEFLQLIWQVAGLSYLWYIAVLNQGRRREKARNLQWIVKS
jgi:hypothetical protein